ncbi:uncharacterized protein LOC130548184 [Triplophysa rosa]|uniref:Thiaminase-2/PQQC domain-containing protein n=1 Tax=Triplophysa rosa TaxID=992332 RepID=A0A9W7X3N5_TRIRA|nr:uncharacterized protein LOC130548184 [Triplophysa rosa]KAI7813428.1 hypothetical protein IRJ41_016889 [Triplophysa rosa]
MRTVALVCFCLLYSSCTSSSLENILVDDVYELLWKNNIGIAYDTYGSEFLREMESGTLQAEKYINFTLQDINYLVKVTEMLREMSERVTEPEDVRDFLNGRYQSYKTFADSMIQQYFFKDQNLAIKETPAMEKYLSDYRTFMKDPLDFIVALLPCTRLWVWLANKMSIPQNSPYYTWKESNMYCHPEKYKPLLNKYLNTPDKVKRANDVFCTQMQNEYHFFTSSLVIDGFCTIIGNNEIKCYDKNVFINV